MILSYLGGGGGSTSGINSCVVQHPLISVSHFMLDELTVDNLTTYFNKPVWR